MDAENMAIAAASAIADMYASLLGNDVSREQFDRMMSWQQKQYYLSREWNSAPNQVSLLRRAGLNPALALQSGVSGGTAEAVGSPSPTASYQPLDLSSSLSGAYASLQHSDTEDSVQDANDASAALNYERATSEALTRPVNLRGLHLSNEEKQWANKNAEQAYLFSSQTMLDRVRQEGQRVMLNDLSMEAQGLLNTAQQFTNGFLPTQIAETIRNTVADTKLKLIQGKTSWIEARAAVKQAAAAWRNALKTNGYYLTPEQEQDFIQAEYDYLLQRPRTEQSNQYKNLFTPFSYGLGPKGITHNTVESHVSDFDNWRSFRQAPDIRSNKKRR